MKYKIYRNPDSDPIFFLIYIICLLVCVICWILHQMVSFGIFFGIGVVSFIIGNVFFIVSIIDYIKPIKEMMEDIEQKEKDEEDEEETIFDFLKVLVKKGMMNDSTAVVFTNNFSVKFLKRKMPLLISVSGNFTGNFISTQRISRINKYNVYEKELIIGKKRFAVCCDGWTKERIILLKNATDRLSNPIWENLRKINEKYRFAEFEDTKLKITDKYEIKFYKTVSKELCSEQEFILSKILKYYDSFEKVVKCSEDNKWLYGLYEEEFNKCFIKYHQEGLDYELELFSKIKLTPLYNPKIVLKIDEIEINGKKNEIKEWKSCYEFDEWLPLFESVKELKKNGRF